METTPLSQPTAQPQPSRPLTLCIFSSSITNPEAAEKQVKLLRSFFSPPLLFWKDAPGNHSCEGPSRTQREVIRCAVYIDSDLIKNKLTTTRPVQSHLNWIWPVQLEPGCLNDLIFIGVRFNPITCSPCDRTRWRSTMCHQKREENALPNVDSVTTILNHSGQCDWRDSQSDTHPNLHLSRFPVSLQLCGRLRQATNYHNTS